MSDCAIEVEGLQYGVGDCKILLDISFSLERGEYLSIIGPNGAGKTSLLRCLMRIVPFDAGEVQVFGKRLSGYTQRDLAKVLSYVPQADGRARPISVYDFTLMGRYPHLSPFSILSREDRDAVEKALTMTGAEAFAERRIDTLSGGERQKVFIAATLAQGSKILLLDEPTTFLDYRHQVEISRLLTDLNREQGITIVSVTHDVNDGVLSTSRVLALKSGRTLYHGPPSALIDGGILESLYDTPFRMVQDDVSGMPIVVTGEKTP